MKKCTFIIGMLFIAISANAYVMPGKQMVKEMAKNIGSTRSMSAVHSFIMHNLEYNEGQPLELKETVIYKFPDSLHSEILMNDKQKLHVVSPRGVVTIIDDVTSEEPHTTFDLYKYLLLERDKSMILQRLSVSGINVNISSYGKFEKKAVYVIGAKYPDESVPQLWLEINTFRPCRWIITPGGYGQSLEIVYRNWKEIRKDVWYPEQIEYVQDTNVLVEIYLKSFKINPEVTKDLFDVSYYRQMYPAKITYDSPYESDMDEVKKTIRDFQRTFE
jgi:outer membrane lipoprotein-sorting protein